jgi:hypothetical protein
LLPPYGCGIGLGHPRPSEWFAEEVLRAAIQRSLKLTSDLWKLAALAFFLLRSLALGVTARRVSSTRDEGSIRVIKILIGLVIVAVIAVALRRRGAVRAQPRGQSGANAGHGLRTQLLSRALFADKPANGSDQPRCVVLDWNLGGTNVATLVAFDDGTTSLYLSSGGGIIGAGAHEAVKQAAAQFRSSATAERARFAAVTQFELPSDGRSVFYLVTDTATLSSGSIANAELQRGAHPLSRLANQAQAVIGAVRQASNAPH